MKIKFYGVRGSLPAPGRNTVEYGGNTTCIRVTSKSGDEYIIDAGTGIRQLGNELMKQYRGKVNARVLISHDHWDHIQGFPFLVPAYVPGCRIEVYSGDKDLAKKIQFQDEQANHAAKEGRSLETLVSEDTTVTAKAVQTNHTKEVFRGQQDVSRGYFPVAVEQMGSELTFRDLKQYEMLSNGLKVRYMFHSAHPGGMFSYRIEENNRTIVFTGDFESDGGLNESGEYRFGPNDEKMIAWVRNAETLIIDAQYTPEEYSTKKGWGHSDIERACRVAAAAQVKNVYLTHHDPLHSDEQLRQMEARAQKYMAEVVKSNIPVVFAREEMEVEV